VGGTLVWGWVKELETRVVPARGTSGPKKRPNGVTEGTDKWKGRPSNHVGYEKGRTKTALCVDTKAGGANCKESCAEKNNFMTKNKKRYTIKSPQVHVMWWGKHPGSGDENGDEKYARKGRRIRVSCGVTLEKTRGRGAGGGGDVLWGRSLGRD